MMKMLTYIIGTMLINGIVIGAPYGRMLDNLGWWIRGKVESSKIFGFYDDLSWLQILLIGICELVLALNEPTIQSSSISSSITRRIMDSSTVEKLDLS